MMGDLEMKKILRATLTFMVLFGLVACGLKTPAWQEQYDLGVRYLSEGNYEEAIIAFTAAIEIDSKQDILYLSLSQAYVEIGDVDAAIDILTKGLENTASREVADQLRRNHLSGRTDSDQSPLRIRCHTAAQQRGTRLSDRWFLGHEPQ